MNKRKHILFSRYQLMVWKQFKKHKPAYVSLYVVLFLFLFAAIAPYIATGKPWYVKYQGEHLFPAFTLKKQYHIANTETGETEVLPVGQTEWKKKITESIFWAPIPYDPGQSDLANYGYKGPSDPQWEKVKGGRKEPISGRFRHLLGTGAKGEDLLSGLIHGTRISLTIGLMSMLIASLIGVALGAAAGYLGDHKLQVKRGTLWMSLPGILLGWFYGFTLRTYTLSDAFASSIFYVLFQLLISILIFLSVIGAILLLTSPLNRLPYFSKKVSVPVDMIISRMIEVMISLPKIIFIITIAAIAKRSMMNVILIIGFTSWTGVARLVRAEMLRIRNMDYISAAKSSGLSSFRIIFRHALPNAIAPALVSISFGVAAAILVESGLSFLNIGVPDGVVTWGSLLSEGRVNIKAWWMIVFPGLAIFLTVTVYNLLGEGLRDALDPKLKE